MEPVAVLTLLAVVACVPLALAASARALVPARFSGGSGTVLSFVVAAGLLPFFTSLAGGSEHWLLWLALSGFVPCLGGLYLRKKAFSPDGRAIGFRAAAELTIWVMCIVMTAGIAIWANQIG